MLPNTAMAGSGSAAAASSSGSSHHHHHHHHHNNSTPHHSSNPASMNNGHQSLAQSYDPEYNRRPGSIQSPPLAHPGHATNLSLGGPISSSSTPHPSRGPASQLQHRNSAASLPGVDSSHGHGTSAFRSTDSSTSSSSTSQPTSSTDLTASLIKTLVHRLVRLLPVTTGVKLATREEDTVTRSCVANLVTMSQFQLPTVLRELMEAMETLNKNSSTGTEQMTTSLLQSQLLILRIMTSCMMYYWRCCHEKNSNHTHPKDSPSRDLPMAWSEPPPLDDQLARQSLSIMTVTLRQTAAREDRQISNWSGLSSSTPSTSSYRQSKVDPASAGRNAAMGDKLDSTAIAASKSYPRWDEPNRDEDGEGIPVSALSLTNGVSLFVLPPTCPPAQVAFEVPSPKCPSLGGLERPQRFKPLHLIGAQESSSGDALTELPANLNKAIYRYTSLVIFFLSSSNWSTVHARVRNRIAFLSGTAEDLPSPADLRIIECSNLNRSRLGQILTELQTTFSNLRRNAQYSAALVCRRAIWSFISNHPAEFAALHYSGERMEGNPELLFGQVFAMADSTRKKQSLWPMLTSLLLLCPDGLTAAMDSATESKRFGGRSSSSLNRKISFLSGLKKGLKSSKLADIAAVCCMDFCKAATYTAPSDKGLRAVVSDLESDLKEKVFDAQRPMLTPSKQIETSLMVEGFIAFFRLSPNEARQALLPMYIAEGSPMVCKVSLVRALVFLSSEPSHIPWHPRVDVLWPAAGPWLRKTFKEMIARLARPGSSGLSNKSGDKRPLLGSGNKGANKGDDLVYRLEFIEAALTLWTKTLSSASEGLTFEYPISLTSLSSEGSALKHDELDQGALQTDSVLAWVYMVGAASCLPGYTQIHEAAQQVLLSCITAANDRHATGQNRTFLNHAQRAIHSCGAVLRLRYSEQLSLADSAADQRHWLSLLTNALGSEVKAVRDFALMTPDERAESPLPGHTEYLLERTILSVGFFISVCSADTLVVSVAITGGQRVVEMRSEARKRADNAWALGPAWIPFWQTLADGSLLTTGRVARQKRLRALFRRINSPVPASLIAWNIVFRKWQAMTQRVLSFKERRDEEFAAQWLNYAGFLCALGGCCVGSAANEEKQQRPPVELLEPAFAIPNQPDQAIEEFIQQMVDLLVSDSVWIQETVKDTLGVDLHPRMTGALFKQIHAVLGDFFEKETGMPVIGNAYTTFVEQSIGVVHQVLSRMEETAEWTAHIDVGSLMVLYVEYANGLQGTEKALRIKTAMCQLCQSLMSKKHLFSFSNELRIRNRLFQALITWTSDAPNEGEQALSKLGRLQRDLDVACLQVIAVMLESLPLLLADDALLLDDKVEWAKSRQFSLYSGYFIKVLNRTRVAENDLSIKGGAAAQGAISASGPANKARELNAKEVAPLRESAIRALSNLLAANIASGLHHSLRLGYSSDPELRTAFMRIMTNVLDQGAAFDDFQHLKKSQDQSKLVELIGDSDLALALSICEGGRIWDPEHGIDRIMLSIFDSRGGILRFLKAAVEEEIDKTSAEELVFRSNSNRVHLLSLFAKTHGYEYLRSIVVPLVTDMANKPKGWSYELDPSRLAPGESSAQNQARVEEIAQMFIDAICKSAAQVPAVMRELCRHIRSVMDRKFPNSRYQGVGGYVFLRFIGPAIAAPQTIDMHLDGSNQENQMLRRGLLFVSKILQTLASNNRFSAHKEPFMFGLNDFLHRNVWAVTSFLDGISDARTDPDRIQAADLPLGYGIHPRGYGLDEHDQASLHEWLYNNVDKVGAELLTRSAVGTADASRTESNGIPVAKVIHDQLCITLAEMGRPAKLSLTPSTGKSGAELPGSAAAAINDSTGPLAQDFHRRTGGRSTYSDIYKKILYEGPMSKAGRSVIYCNPHLQDAETMDVESLISYFLKVMEETRTVEFDFLIDTTGLKASNLIPVQSSLFFANVVGSHLAPRLRTLIFFNPGTHVRLWFNVFKSPGIQVPAAAIVADEHATLVYVNSLSELDAYIERRNVALLPETIALTTAPVEHRFTQVTMVWYYRSLIPVTFKISGEYLQITCLKPQEILGKKTGFLNDVFHLSDIDDVRSVSIRGDDNTFLLTVRGGELAFVFNGRERMPIVQALREARARVSRLRSTTSLDRTLLPTDVPGTLLNMGLLGMLSDHSSLRLNAYNLTCALSASFNFGASATRKRLLSSNSLALPTNTAGFVTDLSKEFASAAPGITLEFFSSFFEGFHGASPSQQTVCLQYMSPWLANLVMFSHTSRERQQEYQRRIRDIFTNLISITTDTPGMFATMQRAVWSQISRLDDLIPLFLDVFTETAIDSGIYTARFDAVVDTMVSFSSMNLRGKLLARLRKAIGRTSQQPTVMSLHETAAWKEITTLARMNMALSFTGGRRGALLYLPESLHAILLLAGIGPDVARQQIRGTLINLVHCLCSEDSKESSRRDAASEGSMANRVGLEQLLEKLASSHAEVPFGLSASAATSSHASSDPPRPLLDPPAVAELAGLIKEVIRLAAPTIDTANSWRARLTSLITGSCFQYNPPVQARAFILLGTLADGEIDDDLLYQILVCLKGAITEWANLGNEGPMISIVTCLGDVVKILPDQSRYLAHMFWLGICMVQYGQVHLFHAGVALMQSTITALQERKVPEANETDLIGLLSEARFDLREAACRLDDETGVDFTNSFAFSTAALLVRGLRHPMTKGPTATLLRCLLEYSSKDIDGTSRSITGRVSSEQLGFFLALLPTTTKPEAFGNLLSWAGCPPEICDKAAEARRQVYGASAGQDDGGLMRYIETCHVKEVLLTVGLIASLLQHAESEAEKLLLYTWLADVGHAHPLVLGILYDYLAPGMRDVLSISTNAAVLEAVHSIAQMAVFEPAFTGQAQETARKGGASTYCAEAGLAILLDCGSFGSATMMSDGRRLIMAKLSTGLLNNLIDAATT